MKKLLVSLIISCLLLNISPSLAASQANIFSDVPPNTPYSTAIEYLYGQNIIQGYEDNTFHPSDNINRAEFVKILTESIFAKKILNDCLNNTSWLFSDVQKSLWYAKHVCVAKKTSLIEGYPDGSFKGKAMINLAEAAKIIANTFFLEIPKLEAGQKWFEPFIKSLENNGIIPNSLKEANQFLNRGEMAEMMYRRRDQLSQTTGEKVLENAPPIQESTGKWSQMKNEIISLINSERSQKGLSSLRYNLLLETSAQLHSIDMRKKHYFDHINLDGATPEDRIKATGYLQPFFDCTCTKSYSTGENIAKGQVTAPEVMNTWMNSPDHRDNILNPDFSEIGIGIIEVDPNEEGFIGYLWVQNFGDISLE